MELIYKAAAAAICVSLICLALKKFNPELTGLMSICTISVILVVTLNFAVGFDELLADARKLIDIPDIYIGAVFKCLAVSLITRLSSDLCKDAGQAALSSTVELVGAVCAAMVVLPLIINMINLVGTMV